MTTQQMKPFAERRSRLLDARGDALAVVPAAPESFRNSDVEHPFRQDSDFFFLTGFDEPDAVAVFNPGGRDERFVLFVRPKDEEKELWHGRRAGVDGARADFGAEQAFDVDDFEEEFAAMLDDRAAIYYRLGNPRWDEKVLGAVDKARWLRKYGHATPSAVSDPSTLLNEMRVRKSAAELEALRRACSLSADGHAEAMRFARPGDYEYQVQAAMEYVFRAGGSPRDGYPAIVASGGNACCLHYTDNDRRMQDGDLLLLDAGCEVGYHTADITRTYPVGGRFSEPQKRVYELVLAAQLEAIEVARPGNPYKLVHDTARRVIAEGLVELGLLPRGVDESLRMHLYREFFPHGTGHWLGMDVHDIGDYKLAGDSRRLQPGMVLTVEPGLYFAPGREQATFYLREFDAEAQVDRRIRLGSKKARKREEAEKDAAEKVEHPIPEEYRGIGVRIEDDILITADGAEVLTDGVPKTVAEVEALCAEPPRLPRL